MGLFIPPCKPNGLGIYNFFRGRGWHYNRGIHADDDSAILYTLLGPNVITDVPVSSARSCHR